MDSKKNARGGEYHNILWNKKFFIHLFFSPGTQFNLRIRNSMKRCEAGCITTASTRQKATVVDPDTRKLAWPEQLKLTFYEEGGTELRCERTFLHICRVLSEVIEDSEII